MNEFSEVMANELVQRSIAIAVTAGIVFALLRIVKPASAIAHRCAWCLALLQGWMIFQFAIPIPWLKVTGGIEIARTGDDISKKETAANEFVPRIPQPVNRTQKSILTNDLEKTNVEKQPAIAEASSPETANIPISIPSQETREASTPFSWQSWLIVFWLTGMAVFVLHWIFGYVRFVRSLSNFREGEASTEPLSSQQSHWQTEWQELLKKRNIPKKIDLTIHEKIGPILCRLPGSYKIVVPRKLWETLSALERRSILEHELAHYQRGDIWKSLAMRILSLPHWFNPCSRLAVREFDQAAEWACDDIVRKRNPETHVTFAKTLMQLVEFDSPSNALRPAAFGSSVGFRVKRLLAPKILEDSKMKKSLIGIIALGVMVLCLVRPQLTAGDPDTDSSAVTPEEKVAQKKEEKKGQRKKTKPKVPRKKLRFDGKSFAEWQEILKTDLSPDQRKKAIRAFGAFGANGYPKEAAEAIAELAYYYEFRTLLLKQRNPVGYPDNYPILGIVAIGEFKSINDPVLIDVLKRLLLNKENSQIWFAIQVLKNRNTFHGKESMRFIDHKTAVLHLRDKELIPELMKVVQSTKGKLRGATISVIQDIDPKTNGFSQLLLKWMLAKDDETSLAACSALSKIAPKTEGLAKRLMEVLMNDPSELMRRRTAFHAVVSLGESAKDALPILMDLIRDDAKRHTKTMDGQFTYNFPNSGLGSGYDVGELMRKIGPIGVVPLLKMYKDGNNVEKFYVLRILQSMRSKAKEALPFLEKEWKEIRNEKGKVMSQLDLLILTTISRIK